MVSPAKSDVEVSPFELASTSDFCLQFGVSGEALTCLSGSFFLYADWSMAYKVSPGDSGLDWTTLRNRKVSAPFSVSTHRALGDICHPRPLTHYALD